MKTAVVLCAERAPAAHPVLDLDDLVDHLVPDLCRRPSLLSQLGIETDRLVTGVCADDFELGPFQVEFRRMGLDPLGVEFVDLDAAAGDPFRLVVMIEAALAKTSAFAGSQPEQAKLSFPEKASRRSLLTFSTPEYRSAPRIVQQSCTAERGCRLCLAVCPQEAIAFDGGAIALDVTACDPCGICVTECPTGAMTLPAPSSTQLEAQIHALLHAEANMSSPRGVAFACSRATSSVSRPGWFGVTVPCVGMVTPTWMLAPLIMGAGAVTIVSCRDGGCPLGNDHLVAERADYCHELLSAFGLPADRVTLSRFLNIPEPLADRELTDPFGRSGAVEVLTAMAELGTPDTRPVSHPASPFGLINIDEQTCTACTLCVRVCPTQALEAEESAQHISISFQPALCTACGQCASVCPERKRGAIELVYATDIEALGSARTPIMEGQAVICESCGAPIASTELIDRLTDLLGPERPGSDRWIRYCVDCRKRSVTL